MNKTTLSIYSFYFLTIALLLCCSVEVNGTFVYTLDDPYIHLEVANNILHGNYGINLSEMSAPSSSILWPFLLAAIHLVSLKLIPLEWIPLLINILSGFLSLYALRRFSSSFFGHVSNEIFIISSFALMSAGNLFGLVFMGMEHSLQIAITLWIVFLLLNKQNQATLLCLIVLAPAIRYEEFAISVPALLYIYLSGNKKYAVLTFFTMLLLPIIFSLFLYFNGLGLMPTSIAIKSGVLSGSLATLLLDKISGNFIGSIDFAILFITAVYTAFTQKTKESFILLFLPMVLHLVFGRTGWFFRYENYITLYSFMLLLYIYRDTIYTYFMVKSLNYKMSRLFQSFFIGILIALLNINVVAAEAMTPLASSNITNQHRKMSIIAKNIGGNVAVNDIGLVSYQNKNYVLDLYGLASKEAINIRLNNDTKGMNKLVKKHNIILIMIYDNWFTSIPENWEKIATLKTDGVLVAPIEREVSIYAPANAKIMSEKLQKLSRIYSLGLQVLTERPVR